MSFSDRTMTEPYTSREVSTVPGEGDANLLLQDSKAAAPYSTKKCAVPFCGTTQFVKNTYIIIQFSVKYKMLRRGDPAFPGHFDQE